MAVALANAGFVVDAVCPNGHPILETSAFRRIYAFRGLMPSRSLAFAIRESNPELVIPGDDLSVRCLHALYRESQKKGAGAKQICAVIERSFGDPQSYSFLEERASFINLAADAGVRAPRTAVIENIDALRKWVGDNGCPVVLKVNGTSGGYGVRIAKTLEEAEVAFRKLQAPPLFARAIKRAIVNNDSSLIMPSLKRTAHVVNAQAFVNGREATSTVACWKGKVLAALHCEVIRKRYTSGPASVMRLIEHPEMISAVEKMVERLNLSGLHGFDFMLEANTGNAHLIEINPRTTQVGHLTLGPGRDLPAAIYAAVTGSEAQAAEPVTANNLIALFPQEWMRDPASTFFKTAYHDVPWSEPGLVEECIRQGRKQHGLKAQESWDTSFAPARVPRA